MTQVDKLESAILERATRLADELRTRAERSRDNIRRETSERLRLREEREVLVGKALAERTFRRKVQANELKLQSQMDNLRWNLVLGIRHRLPERMHALTRDKDSYLGLLKALLAQGAKLIERNELIAEVNRHDHKLLEPLWQEIAGKCAPGKELVLGPDPIDTQGGVLIRSVDNRIRLNNTFEGRLERLSEGVGRIIMEQLFPGNGLGDSRPSI